MHRHLRYLILAIVGLALGAGAAHATTHEFYKGKVIRIVVGFAAGGGFDTYARAIGRHMGRHIPGNPTVIVENMPGAGSLIAANHVYMVAKPDGLTMGHFIGGLFMLQVFGKPGVEFDARKFEYVGVPVKDNPTCVFTRASGITSIEKWLAAKTPVKVGAVAPGSTTDDVPKLLMAAIGVPLQVVSGYKGTSAIRLAAESGEVAGGCWGWESIRATWRKGIETGEVAVVLQTAPQPAPDIPSVPLAMNFAKTDEARQLIKVGIQDAGAITRPFVVTPGTPQDRVQLLRKAFLDTLKDPEFLTEAQKTKLDVEPMSGEELERTVRGLFKLEPAFVAKLKDILK
ncbi:MAG TPA: tripartite tricarboxylate transporter substrate-binding protein [Methylomirabilota bacterium]|jgi:tripartite-type tricarboxylate transporter receptor subunit TctC|nr:tripartite tricarboxylate transporter substrate-binding protein [Methylomirabilota bacterium]